MKNKTLSAGLLLVLTLAFVVAPALTPPFTGYKPDQLPVPILRHAIQPAGYAFAIWGVIYLWLIAHAGYGLWRRSDDPAWLAPRWPLIGSVGLGTVWLAIATSWPLLATAVIIVMAGLAVAAFLQADVTRDRWFLSAPLAIYAGWLTAATLASMGIILGGYGALPHESAALVLIGLSVVIALMVQARKPGMPIYALTVVWALIAIAVANWGVIVPVVISALTAAAIIAVGAIVMALRRH